MQIISGKIFKKNTKNSKIKLLLQKQKIPVNYFQVNIIIDIFILFTAAALIYYFFINILKFEMTDILLSLCIYIYYIYIIYMHIYIYYIYYILCILCITIYIIISGISGVQVFQEFQVFYISSIIRPFVLLIQ